jgi:hypothetical protein
MAGLSTLSDTFETGSVPDPAKWPTVYGTSVTVTGGRLRKSCDTSYAGIQSASIYTFDSWTTEPFPPAQAGATTDAYHALMCKSFAAPDGSSVGYFIDRVLGQMHCVIWVGYFDAGAVTLTYNATNHAWLHCRYTGSQIIWESSLTLTGTRTVLRTASGGAIPAYIGASDFFWYADTHRNNGSNNFAELGAFNPPTAIVTSGTARATATATGVSSKLAATVGSARAVALGTGTSRKLVSTAGSARAVALGTGTSRKVATTTGNGRAVALGTGTSLKRAVTTGTARAIATATGVSSSSGSSLLVRHGGEWVPVNQYVRQGGEWVAGSLRQYHEGEWR